MMQLHDPRLFQHRALMDGSWYEADNHHTIAVTNPATGDTLGTVPDMGATETRRAINAAQRALPIWRALTAKQRAHILRRWFGLIIEHQDDLARLMTLEQGKPLAERGAKSPMRHRLSNGLPRKESVSMVRPSPAIKPTSA